MRYDASLHDGEARGDKVTPAACAESERHNPCPVQEVNLDARLDEQMMEPMLAEERAIRARLEELRQEHRDLDTAIDALVATTPHDQLQVKRLKKRKLWLRDQLSKLEDLLIPDIIA